MPRGIPLSIGSHHWPTKKAALEFYKAILNKYSPPCSLSEEDYQEIYMLLQNHPNATQKLEGGIVGIRVDYDEYNGQCFHIERPNGTLENFSYIKCVNG